MVFMMDDSHIDYSKTMFFEEMIVIPERVTLKELVIKHHDKAIIKLISKYAPRLISKITK
jgi:hypothetical protein